MSSRTAWDDTEPEAPVQLASLGARLVAFLIDAIPIGAAFLLDAHYFGTLTNHAHHFQASVSGVPGALLAVGVVSYFTLCEGRAGATIGKAILGIRVVALSDPTAPPGVGRALVRTLLRIADAFPYLIPYVVGFVAALISGRDRRQRLGDLAAGTVVVRRR
jgi:uncharacterized RDD family membrane protein YckC